MPRGNMARASRPVKELIHGLKTRADALRPRVRPSPIGSMPLPWRKDPAVLELENLGDDDVVEVVENMLEDDEPVVRTVGVHLLIENELEDLLPRAVEGLEEIEDEMYAAMVLAAIGRLGADEYQEQLRGGLGHPSTFWAAVESLALIGGDDALEDLQKAIETPDDSWDKLDVVKVIGDVGGEFAVPLLTRILEDDSEAFAPVRGYAAQSLGARGDEAAVPALTRALQDETMPEKGRVLWGLGQIADPEAWDVVEPFVHDAEKPWWRGEALKALAAMDPERAHDIVIEMARNDAFFRKDREAFSDVIRALAHIVDDTATGILIDSLRRSVKLGPATDALYDPPAWLPDAGARLQVVILTALGAHYGVDIEPRISHQSASEIAREQAHRLAEFRRHDVPRPLRIALDRIR